MERFAWKGKLRNWLPQYRENLTLAVPVMLSQVGQVVVQLADNAMVGRLGALPLAGVSFGGAVFVIFMFWGMGVSLGLTPLVGEAYAKRDLVGGPLCSRTHSCCMPRPESSCWRCCWGWRL